MVLSASRGVAELNILPFCWLSGEHEVDKAADVSASFSGDDRTCQDKPSCSMRIAASRDTRVAWTLLRNLALGLLSLAHNLNGAFLGALTLDLRYTFPRMHLQSLISWLDHGNNVAQDAVMQGCVGLQDGTTMH